MNEVSDIGSVRTVVAQLYKRGITDVVLSPGSRNAPFILSFNSIDAFSCHSVLDERSAGFIALGMAQQSGKPAVLSCTSGSAVVNYAPALAEAYYQRIPMVLITADRPAAWIDQGEGQSMRQTNALSEVVAKSVHLVEEQSDIDAWHNHRLANEALEIAIREQRPVQINVPLSEPLYNTAPLELEDISSIRYAELRKDVSGEVFEDLNIQWVTAKRIVILATQGANAEKLQSVLSKFHDDPRVAIVTETNANLYHLGYISCIDRTIEAFIGSKNEAEYIPDLLITIGGNVISKKLKAMFRRHKEQIVNHWHLGSELMDTFQSLTQWIDVDPATMLGRLEPVQSVTGEGFGTKWKARFFEAEQRHEQFVQDSPYADLKVFSMITQSIPDGSVLQMGNSSVVRYIQLFNQLRGVRYYGNRGVSGIEGCTSTAVGAAMASDRLVTLISGDQAFRYDSNALEMAMGQQNLRIIVINNGGGNIFRIIDGPTRHEVSEDFIEKKDEASIQGLVDHSGIAYRSANDIDSLLEGLDDLFSPDRSEPMVLEVFTPRIESPEILKAYFGALRG